MKLEFSKHDTLVTKGIAIIFLVFYHCLSSKDRLLGYTVDFTPFKQSHAMYIFEAMNICVGMFAFLSAFGLTRNISYSYKRLDINAKETSVFLTKRTISLLGSFFLPFVICVVVSLSFTDYNPYGTGINFVFNLIADMLGISALIGSKLMIGTWWYMSFALVIIFLMPLTCHLYKKFGVFVLVPYIVLPVLLKPGFFSASGLTNMTRWLLCIPLGVIFAEGRVFEKLKELNVTKSRVLSKIIKFIILTVVLCALILFRRTGWCEKYFFYFISSVLPVVFIYFIYEFICDIPIIKTVLSFLGKHSSNIFFVHTFIRGVWLTDFTYSLGNWVLIGLFVLLGGLVISLCIEGLKALTRWNRLLKLVTDKAVKRIA